MESIASTALAVESAVEAALRRTEMRAREACERLKEDIRENPAQAVFLAAAAGYVFNRLPMRSLCVSGFKIFSAFTPPTLLALGICKVAEYWKRRKAESSSRLPTQPAPVSEVVIVMTDAA